MFEKLEVEVSAWVPLYLHFVPKIRGVFYEALIEASMSVKFWWAVERRYSSEFFIG